MSLAEDTRAAARRRPALVAALRAGVVNYTAAARFLSEEVEGDTESVATALRRFAESLPDHETDASDARVSMKSGLGEVETELGEIETELDEVDGPDADADLDGDSVLSVGGTHLASGAGSLTGVVAEGDVDGRVLAHLLGRLNVEGIEVQSAGVADETLVVAVERRDGPDALRVVEDALDAVRR